MTKYLVYGKNSCPWCDRAKALLESKGLEYEYKLVKSEEGQLTEAYDEMLAKYPAASTVPQIFEIDEDANTELHIGGFVQLAAYFN
jgi:glutaredoxin 3